MLLLSLARRFNRRAFSLYNSSKFAKIIYMIKIQLYKDIEPEFFDGRDFGGSIDIVKDVLSDVKNRGDAALSEYGAKFDVSAPASIEIPMAELKAAAEKMQKENPELYKAIEYSHDLALRFAKKQRESFDDFEVELEPGVFTGQKNIAVDRAGAMILQAVSRLFQALS